MILQINYVSIEMKTKYQYIKAWKIDSSIFLDVYWVTWRVLFRMLSAINFASSNILDQTLCHKCVI